MAGLTSTGFTIETTTDIVTDINQREQAAFGAAFDVSATGPAGQLNGVVAQKLAEVWQLAGAVYTSQDPTQASGAALDQLLKLTGVTRLAATQGTVTVTLTGTSTTVVPAGTTFSVAGTNSQSKFAMNASATITAGTATAVCTCTQFGPVLAPAGTLTVIETPVGGLTSVTNPLDALAGTNVETDAAARTRRNLLLQANGLGSVNAIRGQVLGVAGVTQAIVLENTSATTDGNGTPGHAFLTLSQGGTDQLVANAIFSAKPAGIQAYGSTIDTVTDTYGNTHSVGFSRPTAVPVYITVNLAYDHTAGAYAGDAAVKQAIATYGNGFAIGQSVVRSLLFGQIEAVAGILDITSITLGLAPSPAGTSNITITPTQLAAFDTSRIVVVST